jgi:glutathione S-transferase
MFTLRYFSCLGRAQALRHALADANVPHEDVQVTSGWSEHKDDRAFAGPYGGLPTLTCDGETLGETLAIASLLARRLGHCEGLSAMQIARHEAICSNVYLEALTPVGQFLWADFVYPGMDFTTAFPRVAGRVLAKMERLEAETPSGFFGGTRPIVADFFAAEGYEALRHLLGPARDDAVAVRLPRLASLASRIRARPAIARLRRPERFTARPDEPRILELVRALPLAALGP